MDQDLTVDDESNAFPASPLTPGQTESRNAYARFMQELIEKACPWIDDYNQLRNEGWDWRKATYIAWAASPIKDRWPTTQGKLAVDVLGLNSDRTIQKWRENDPAIDKRVEEFRTGLFSKHLTDIINASITVATSPTPQATPERKMIFEMTGLYKSKSAVAVTGADGGPVEFEDVGLSDEERSHRIVALLDAARARRDRDVVDDGSDDLAATTGAANDGVLQPGQ